MRSSNLRQRIGKSLKKSSRKPSFLTKPEITDAPQSRWHVIKLERGGKLYLFEMNVNDYPKSDGVIKLGHVKVADMEKDEWIEVAHSLLEEFRRDAELMGGLRAQVESIEEARVFSAAAEYVGEQSAEPELPADEE